MQPKHDIAIPVFAAPHSGLEDVHVFRCVIIVTSRANRVDSDTPVTKRHLPRLPGMRVGADGTVAMVFRQARPGQ